QQLRTKMRFGCHCLCWVLFFILGAWSSHARTLQDARMIQRHEEWMVRYGKVYKDTKEKEMRYKIFKENVARIDSFNNNGPTKTYKLDVNQFADLSNEEFKSRNTFKVHTFSDQEAYPLQEDESTAVAALPSSIDWRKKGAVTPIKDQGQCGAWAFSAVAAIEGLHAITTGKLIALSEQEIVDCDSQGCQGGWTDNVYDFVIRNHGIASQKQYPYHGDNNTTCNLKEEALHAATIGGYVDLPANDEAALMNAVARQPVAAAIDAGGFEFQFYVGGVFTGSCGTNLDHGVAVVGYGETSNGTKYWLVKNSWGTKWGEGGYMLMQKDDALMIQRHEEWMVRYGRVYKDANEKEMRYKIFKENVARIDSFNSESSKTYKLGMNQFADLTNDEFKSSRNRFKGHMCSEQAGPFRYENVTAVPATMDWRKKGAVTPIKDQGQCEQELVDCDTKGEDQGCQGGLMDDAFKFVEQIHGITTETNYPYTAQDGTCNSKKEGSHAATITGYEDVPANNEAALMKAVAHQPIAVAIDAGGYEFQFYSSGVFTGSCGTELDHGVAAVGYGESDGMKYWLVKNSWGAQWGEEGYIRMQKD
ncbi:hypothetical protein Tsubulata_036749, partial [Turnera subulata]